ncbi:MAG: hypothetical protein JWM20_859 [Patescibacteria group bacterium]|nr:hypothetical protein [Patescibacteria group bacterium]
MEETKPTATGKSPKATVLIVIHDHNCHKPSKKLFGEAVEFLIERSDADIAFTTNAYDHHELVLSITPEGSTEGAMPAAGIFQEIGAELRWMGRSDRGDAHLLDFKRVREPHVASKTSLEFNALKHARSIRNCVPGIMKIAELKYQTMKLNSGGIPHMVVTVPADKKVLELVE